MPVVVRHRDSGERFVLLGAGYGVHKTYKPQTQIFGTMFSTRESGEIFVAMVCNRDGVVSWEKSSDLVVESVDDMTPAEALAR